MKHIALPLSFAVLAACSQNPDGSTSLWMKGSSVWFATAPAEAIAAHFGATCQAYGYQPGTAEMRRCIQDSAQEGRAQAHESAAYTSEAFGRSQAAFRRQPLNCRSYTAGGSTTTNCY